MGAYDDWVEFDGNLTEFFVEKLFRDHQEDCEHESGCSYSGRLNMCNGLVLENKIFNSYYEAQKYISSKFKKWENAIGVRYLESAEYKDDTIMLRLKTKRSIIEHMLYNLQSKTTSQVETKLKEVEFIKCDNCKSKLDTRFRTKTLRCPICDASFATKSQRNKRDRLNKQHQELNEKIQQRAKVLQEKADKKLKNRKVIWLIGGLCSS